MAAKADVSKGAFVIDDEEDFDLVLVATGSEVNLALDAAKLLREQEVRVRVVSMPSQELFLAQDYDYQDEVLPEDRPVISIEAASTYGWNRFANFCIGLDHFGASAPYKVLAEKFGFTPEGIVDQVAEFFSCEDDDDDCSCGCGCSCGCEDK